MFLGDIGSSHLDDGVPSTFDEAIGGLTARVGGNYLGLVCFDPSKRLATDDLVVKVGVVLGGDGAGVRTVGLKSSNYVGRDE